MPRRPLPSATPTRSSSLSKHVSLSLPPPDDTYSSNLTLLRTNWKWAAFSQFFYTFASLLSIPDISLINIEDDLAWSTSLYIPRVIHRLLYTLTQDRKINIDNWQSALRKQYLKRPNHNNPLGPEPIVQLDTVNDEQRSLTSSPPPDPQSLEPQPSQSDSQHLNPSTTLQSNPSRDSSAPIQPNLKHESSPVPSEPSSQSRDWFDLPLLEKLDSLHTLTEWQFQNPHRLRSFMKSDDDSASWRIEPIGYDSKTNAYWLIGPDRLWIQRVPPKPPRPPKRKRQPPRKPSSTKPSTSKLPAEDSDDDSVEKPSKRKRTQPRSKLRTRSSASASEPSTLANGTRARAAKVQANKKLDAQAKELAEFQRQAAAVAKMQSVSRKGHAPSPRKTILGTRASARLRGSDHTEDDEWQPIPAEWLEETVHNSNESSVTRITRSSLRSKGKARAIISESEADLSDKEAEGGNAKVEGSRLQTGSLSDDSDSSELTELSDIEPESPPKNIEPTDPSRARNKTRSRLANGKVGTSHSELEKALPEGEDDVVVESTPVLPSDFIEWEAICITLFEWEHISERFEKATHYLEKALYKVLSKGIVPEVTADLKEAERKRKIEEAIVHRKRSSRIAIKESEKEEARLLAKKKAEDEEKLARTRRIEARAKKEEAERAKREQAREQRRLEREDRERRAQAKEEKRQKARALGEREVSSSAPTPSSAPSPSPSHLVQSTPSSGAKTPDWILDCEICGKRGVNIDDGLPMVSCGSCSRWQHITCYDHVDRIAGRPRRNWEHQQFFCQRCRTQGIGTVHSHHPYSVDDRHPLSGFSQKPVVSYSHQAYYPQFPSRMRESLPSENDTRSAYQYVHTNNTIEAGLSRTQYSQPQSVYSHFQSDQRSFSSQPSQLHVPAFNHRPQASSSQLPQYGSSYTNGSDSGKGSARQSPPYVPSVFNQPSSVRETYSVSDTRYSTSRDIDQMASTATDTQSRYGSQGSYLSNGSWRYPSHLNEVPASDRSLQFFRPRDT